MRLKTFIFSSLLLLTGCVTAIACGPALETVNPIVFHFYQDYDSNPGLIACQQQENLRLWQAMTSGKIPLKAIEAAVYRSTLEELNEVFSSGKPRKTENAFLNWIISNKANDIKEFLLTAKELEELREERLSPWYYPTNKEGYDSVTDEKRRFEDIIARCDAGSRGRLADRYALQKIRALIATRRWQDCIDSYNKTFTGYSDSSLMKRMAKGYVAGAISRLGDTETADSIFAELGDFYSLSTKRDINSRFIYMAKKFPESENLKTALNSYIGYGNKEGNLPYLQVADAALTSPAVKHKGDWLFLKAYIEYVYNCDAAKAAGLMAEARKHTFSKAPMADDARFFEICVRAEADDLRDLADNAYWAINSYGNKDVVWCFLLPALLRQNRVTDALILANYEIPPEVDEDFRSNHNGKDTDTYAHIGFQLLVSRKPEEVEAYRRALAEGTSPLVTKLGHRIRKDRDYLDEITGTLYLREGNYGKAAEYLSRVSHSYQRSMNLYKEKCLIHDPWVYAYTPSRESWEFDRWSGDEYDRRSDRPDFVKSKTRPLKTQKDAKLNFAREMLRLENVMTNGNTSDERGLARLRYTIGRYNSFNNAWALTQYWLGTSNQVNYHYYFFTNLEDRYPSVGTYIPQLPAQLKEVNMKFPGEIDAIISSLVTPEAKAEAHLMLRNYRTIARHYPNTEAAHLLAASCDAWKDWL